MICSILVGALMWGNCCFLAFFDEISRGRFVEVDGVCFSNVWIGSFEFDVLFRQGCKVDAVFRGNRLEGNRVCGGVIFQAFFGCSEKFVIIYALYIIEKHQKMRHQGKHFFLFTLLWQSVSFLSF